MKIIISFILCLYSFNIYGNCDLKVRVTDFPPQYYYEKGQWKGLGVELAEVLLNESGCSPVFTKLPWKRALLYMKNGKIDLMLNLSITEERKKFINFIGPQRDEFTIIAVHKDSDFKISSFDDIKKISGKTGIQRGAFYGKFFDKKYKSDDDFKEKFYIVTNAIQLEHMLKKGRLTGFFIDKYNLFYRGKNVEIYKEFKAHPFIINHEYVYFGLSKKSVSKNLLIKLQKGYEKAKSKGAFEKVLNRYR